jgi:hypothetical protein
MFFLAGDARRKAVFSGKVGVVTALEGTLG